MSDDSLIKRFQLPLPCRYVEPRTATEARLAKIWASVLSVDRIGVDDGYLDLGGDSLHAEVICDLIEEAFGIALPLGIFAEVSTIAALAPIVDSLTRAPRGSSSRSGA